jgi:serine/threonine-protein kinase
MGMGRGELKRWLNPLDRGEESKAFFQRRMALYCGAMALYVAAVLLYVNIVYPIYPHIRPRYATAINFLGLFGLACQTGGWLMCRRETPSSWTFLNLLDFSSCVITGWILAAVAVLSNDRPPNVYSAFVLASYAVLARGLMVPSTGQRTAVFTGVAMAPMVVLSPFVDLDFPRPALVAIGFFFCVSAVAFATIGSNVIYGLRAKVREAMQLGQYTVENKIGEGGMGTVYKARHALLRRPTAIKMLRPERAGWASLARFELEVQHMAELTHPNTVAIYDYGRSPDGVFYYAMEYLDGVDLQTLVDEMGPQAPERVIHVLLQVCGALREAHGRGLIHRDVKPGNIMLCRRGDVPDVAVVVDFGLVKQVIDGSAITSTNAIAGTPAYLAPEAVTAPDQVGAASDLYSLGGVAYFLLTGRPVFNGASVIEVCMQQVDAAPTPPSEALGRPLPAELEALLLRCLAKDPADRPASAAALAAALAKLPEATAWTEDRAADWWQAYAAGHRPWPVTGDRTPSLATITIDLAARAHTTTGAADAAAGDD